MRVDLPCFFFALFCFVFVCLIYIYFRCIREIHQAELKRTLLGVIMPYGTCFMLLSPTIVDLESRKDFASPAGSAEFLLSSNVINERTSIQ